MKEKIKGSVKALKERITHRKTEPVAEEQHAQKPEMATYHEAVLRQQFGDKE